MNKLFPIAIVSTLVLAMGCSPVVEDTAITVDLCQKDVAGNTWACNGTTAVLTYEPEGEEFEYSIAGTVPLANTDYVVVYQRDPWGTGIDCLGAPVTSGAAGEFSVANSIDLAANLPNGDDNAGAKIWVVLAAEMNCGTGALSWTDPDNYLFENYDVGGGEISYTDTTP